MITMTFEPRKTVTWEEFKEYPAFSIALDGYCSGPPRNRYDGLVMSMNHHEGVDDLATRSTCEQALCHVKLGLYSVYQIDGKPHATLWLNDPDEDAALATFVLMHPHYVHRPKLQEIVNLEDHLDMSAGLYPPDRCDQRLMRQMCWIYEQYREARLSGELFRMDGDGMYAIVKEIHRRISATMFGRGKEIQPDTRFETLAENGGWWFVKEIGGQARTGMASHGVQAYVVLKSQADGRYDYSIGRLSTIIPFPLTLFYAALNEADGIGEDETDRWGGGRVKGGSPRGRGSRLTPEEVTDVIDRCLEMRRKSEAHDAP